jgi:hypothetical protein
MYSLFCLSNATASLLSFLKGPVGRTVAAAVPIAQNKVVVEQGM